ncbi:hypothetical protein [Pseudomonas nunensis]|uniref:hypothetical protein n=1 Tax=Pseudomonas nunensis TaxID=2961896 RepID=UPI0009E8907F|nr:hypothetical protein [Pseudomonas nunensis]
MTAFDGPGTAEDQLGSKASAKLETAIQTTFCMASGHSRQPHTPGNGTQRWQLHVALTSESRSPNAPFERRFYEMHHILQSKVMDHAVA